MDKNINMSGEFYLADFGYFSMSNYTTLISFFYIPFSCSGVFTEKP